MSEINYHPVFRPFINFLVSLVIPAACIYLFAYKSFDTITVLKAENNSLKASMNNIVPGVNTVIVHDTLYQKGEPEIKTVFEPQYIHDTIARTLVKHDTVTVYRPDNSCDSRIKILRDSLDFITRNYKNLIDSRSKFRNSFDGYYEQMENNMKKAGDDVSCCSRYRITGKFIGDITRLVKNY
ncbi:MAG: hypothetical protein ACM3H8_10510 [Sphingobacteriales bacterium]